MKFVMKLGELEEEDGARRITWR